MADLYGLGEGYSLLRQMFIAQWIGEAKREGDKPATTANLCKAYGISPATLKRDIVELRHMGMEIFFHSKKGYVCTNWPSVKQMVHAWRRAEVNRAEAMLNTEGMLREESLLKT